MIKKGRIEVNSEGEFYLVIPEDIVQELVLSEGDLVEWDLDGNLVVLEFS